MGLVVVPICKSWALISKALVPTPEQQFHRGWKFLTRLFRATRGLLFLPPRIVLIHQSFGKQTNLVGVVFQSFSVAESIDSFWGWSIKSGEQCQLAPVDFPFSDHLRV